MLEGFDDSWILAPHEQPRPRQFPPLWAKSKRLFSEWLSKWQMVRFNANIAICHVSPATLSFDNLPLTVRQNRCIMPLPNTWEIVYYETEDNECLVESFIDRLRKKEQQKVLAQIALLEEKGILLHRPFAEYLHDDVYELRVKVSRTNVRVLYFFWQRNRIVITHGFKKQVKKVPKTEIDKAIRYRQDWIERNKT